MEQQMDVVRLGFAEFSCMQLNFFLGKNFLELEIFVHIHLAQMMAFLRMDEMNMRQNQLSCLLNFMVFWFSEQGGMPGGLGRRTAV